MLDDHLTLLDDTEVATIGGLARIYGLDFWYVHDLVHETLIPETVLDGVPYYAVTEAAPLIAGDQ